MQDREHVALILPPGPLGIQISLVRTPPPSTSSYCTVTSVGSASKFVIGDLLYSIDRVQVANWSLQDVSQLLLSRAETVRTVVVMRKKKPHPSIVAPAISESEMQERHKRAREHALTSLPASENTQAAEYPKRKRGRPRKDETREATQARSMPKGKPGKQRKVEKKKAAAERSSVTAPPPQRTAAAASAAVAAAERLSVAAAPPKRTVAAASASATAVKVPETEAPHDSLHRPEVKGQIVKSYELKVSADKLESLQGDSRLEGDSLALERLKELCQSMRQESEQIMNSRPDSTLNTGERNLKGLIKFKEEHGHCNVPSSYKNKSLAAFVMKMRERHRKRSSVSSQRGKQRLNDDIGFLNRLEFYWGAPGASPIDWDTHYEKLKAFVAEKGHARVPQIYEPDKRLGSWVHAQRKDYENLKEGKKSPLTEEKIKKLEDIGFQWKLRIGRPKKTDERYRRVSRKSLTNGNNDTEAATSHKAENDNNNEGENAEKENTENEVGEGPFDPSEFII